VGGAAMPGAGGVGGATTPGAGAGVQFWRGISV